MQCTRIEAISNEKGKMKLVFYYDTPHLSKLFFKDIDTFGKSVSPLELASQVFNAEMIESKGNSHGHENGSSRPTDTKRSLYAKPKSNHSQELCFGGGRTPRRH